jgi:hypothetical protein
MPAIIKKILKPKKNMQSLVANAAAAQYNANGFVAM